MSLPASPVSRRLAYLFLLALLGILVMVGVLIAALVGWLPALVFGVAAGAAVVLGARTARRRARARARALGRTCTCCTTSVHDPVTVI